MDTVIGDIVFLVALVAIVGVLGFVTTLLSE